MGLRFDDLDEPEIGEAIHRLCAELFPIPRSLTGPGMRATLELVSRHVPLERVETPSGTQVFDWTVPPEWTIREAFIRNEAGERVVDFARNNLHVVGYSEPVRARMPLSQLRRRVFTLPERPHAIPYRTSYYERGWGFCMEHARLEALPEGEYEAVIDSTLAPGALVWGEYVHRGESEDEILLTTHVCHPSMANDNCSGVALLALLAERIARQRTRLTYRFLFASGTIGAIAWLARNEARVGRIAGGLVLSGLGDGGGPNYKRSRRGDAPVDRAMAHVLRHRAPQATVTDFTPYGYDERQYCSPGFDLPVGSLQRSRWGAYPEYHTSDDDLDFIRPEHLASSYRIVAAAIEVLENDARPLNLAPKCEPQLGRRGVYAAIGGNARGGADAMSLLWTLNLADGTRSLLDIAERAQTPFPAIAEAARLLAEHGLLRLEPQASAPSVKPGQDKSRFDTTNGVNGHSIPKAGSSKRKPLAASGTCGSEIR